MDFRFASRDTIYREMGKRIQQYRIASEMTQAQLAEKCGISKRSIERVESGENRNMDVFLAVLQAFNLQSNISLLVPEQELRPTDIIKQPKLKKRVYHSKKQAAETKTIQWGDE